MRHITLSLTLLLISVGLYLGADKVQPYQVDAETTQKVAAFFAAPVPGVASSPESLSRWLDEKKNLPDPQPPTIDDLPAGTWSPERADYNLEMEIRKRFAESGVSKSDLREWIGKSLEARQKTKFLQYFINTTIFMIILSSLYLAAALLKKSFSLRVRTRSIISTYIFYYISVNLFYISDFFHIVDDENIKPLLAIPFFFSILTYTLYKWVTHSRVR